MNRSDVHLHLPSVHGQHPGYAAHPLSDLAATGALRVEVDGDYRTITSSSQPYHGGHHW